MIFRKLTRRHLLYSRVLTVSLEQAPARMFKLSPVRVPGHRPRAWRVVDVGLQHIALGYKMVETLTDSYGGDVRLYFLGTRGCNLKNLLCKSGPSLPNTVLRASCGMAKFRAPRACLFTIANRTYADGMHGVVIWFSAGIAVRIPVWTLAYVFVLPMYSPARCVGSVQHG